MNSFLTILSTMILVGILGSPVQSHFPVENHNRDKNGTSGVHQNVQIAQKLQYKGCESLVSNAVPKDSFGAAQTLEVCRNYQSPK